MISDAIDCGTTFDSPFPYFVSRECLTKEASHVLLDWFQNGAPWSLVEAEFYEQYEFRFRDIDLPALIKPLCDPINLAKATRVVEKAFGVSFSDQVDVTAHKLVSGQRIRIHNDFIPGAETHRVLVQLNRGWAEENGGILVFFNSEDPADIHRAFRPLHNSCVAFAISPNSHHAVSTIHGGERYTLVYSFYQKGS